MNVVAGIALTLKKAATSDFQAYARDVLRNAKVLAGALIESGMKLITDGTDNHMMVLDTVASVGLDGRPRTCSIRSLHREQASYSRRSSPAAEAERYSSWDPGGDDAWHGRNRNASYRRVHCGGSAGERRRCGRRAPQVRVRRNVPSFSCSRPGV